MNQQPQQINPFSGGGIQGIPNYFIGDSLANQAEDMVDSDVDLLTEQYYTMLDH